MIGVILAAGMAKRLRPLTDACPKCLLKIGERTLLQRTVDAMMGAGINELVVVTGYRGEILLDIVILDGRLLVVHQVDAFLDDIDSGDIIVLCQQCGDTETDIAGTCDGYGHILALFLMVSEFAKIRRKNNI